MLNDTPEQIQEAIAENLAHAAGYLLAGVRVVGNEDKTNCDRIFRKALALSRTQFDASEITRALALLLQLWATLSKRPQNAEGRQRYGMSRETYIAWLKKCAELTELDATSIFQLAVEEGIAVDKAIDELDRVYRYGSINFATPMYRPQLGALLDLIRREIGSKDRNN